MTSTESPQTFDPSCGVILFTDGSCYYKDRIGGWAWVAIDWAKTIEAKSGHADDTTVNRMELTGPAQGLTWLADTYGPCDVWVFSDSEYVVLGARDPTRSRKKNPKFWKRLDKAIEMHHTVEWTHVKGHSDNEYNDLADKLAGKARKGRLKCQRLTTPSPPAA